MRVLLKLCVLLRAWPYFTRADDKKENKMKNSHSYEAGGPMRRELY